jgi:hypothetical protein
MATGKNVEIVLYWIKHGYSCADVAGKLPGVPSAIKSTLTVDPILSDAGRYEATRVSKDDVIQNSGLKDVDAILAADTRRSLETAMYLFDGLLSDNAQKPLIIVPFISEKRSTIAKLTKYDLENMSKGFNKLREYWEENGWNTNNKFKLMSGFDKELMKKLGSESAYTNFVKFILPRVLKKTGKDDISYKIAIVSHDTFISDHLNKAHPRNPTIKNVKDLAVWKEKIETFYNPDDLIFGRNINVTELGNDENDCRPGTVNDKTCQVYPGTEPTDKDDATNYGRCKNVHDVFNSKIFQKYTKSVESTKEKVKNIKLPENVTVPTLSLNVRTGTKTFSRKKKGSTGSKSPTGSPSMEGGDEYYYYKYLKYKNKYNDLKLRD